jgi:hypothetical protein
MGNEEAECDPRRWQHRPEDRIGLPAADGEQPAGRSGQRHRAKNEEGVAGDGGVVAKPREHGSQRSSLENRQNNAAAFAEADRRSSLPMRAGE